MTTTTPEDLNVLCARIATCAQQLECLIDSCEPSGTRVTIRMVMCEIQAVLREIHCHHEKLVLVIDQQLQKLRQWLQRNVVDVLLCIKNVLDHGGVPGGCAPQPLPIDWECCRDVLDTLRLHYVYTRCFPAGQEEHVAVLVPSLVGMLEHLDHDCTDAYLENALYYIRLLREQYCNYPTVLEKLQLLHTTIEQKLQSLTCAHSVPQLEEIDISQVRLPFALSGPDIFSRVERLAVLYMIIPPAREHIVFHCNVFASFSHFRNFLYSLYKTQPFFIQLSKRDQFVLAKWNIVTPQLRALLFDEHAMRYYDQWIRHLC